jgi:hypothetical protein
MAAKEGLFSKIMGLMSQLAGIIHQFFKYKNTRLEQNDREDIRENEEAKIEIESRNRAEELATSVKNAQTAEERQKLLDEFRKKISR